MFFYILLILCICLLWALFHLHQTRLQLAATYQKYDRYDSLITAYNSFQTGTASNNLFIKYGGMDAVQTIVDSIAANAGADATLSPFFGVLNQTGHDTGAQLKSLLDLQISYLLGSSWVYPGRSFTRGVCVQGRSMKASHAGLQITNAIFDRFLTIAIIPALISAGVSDADIAAASPALENLRKEIVTA